MHPVQSVSCCTSKSQPTNDLARIAAKESWLLLLSSRLPMLRGLAGLDPIATANRAFLAFNGLRNLL
jgi:hypothetical protein